ncbi:TIGR02234 family membrane protein [Kitasatospora herbaricolor]|uniref:TIGR02234 family membrane protein n=1 Tax=Kitasatospora herbaricolor TaxID=68217 RepID=UPI0036D7DB42
MSALPEPRTAEPRTAEPRTAEPGTEGPRPGAPAGRPAARGRRTLGPMLLLTVLGAVLVLTAVSRVWATGTVAGVTGGTLDVSVTGSTVSGLPTGLALAALAAAVAVFAVRGAGRIAVGVLMALAGLGVAAGAAANAGDATALHTEAARKLALAGAQAEQVGHSVWPWIALAGGLLIVLAGLLTVRFGRDWPGMGSRYDAPTRKAPAKAGDTPADLWKALDRGEDPTTG